MSIKIELSEPQKQEDIEIMLKNENSGSGGVEDYKDLLNLPKVNGVTLLGNKTSDVLGFSLGYTTEQLDYLFEHKELPKVESEVL